MVLLPSLCSWGRSLGAVGSGLAGEPLRAVLGPTDGWESGGKESLQAPVDSLNYQLVLVSQKLKFDF